MTENSYFLTASLIGVLLGTISIYVFTRYFSPNSYNETTIQTRQESRTEPVVAKETEFSADWFTSTHIFNLEKRAIFSKFICGLFDALISVGTQSWIFLTHSTRFFKPGDYHTFNLNGFSIFLILGKDYRIRAFHNVCRHRAYTITRKESGSSTVLGCKYHGWSYDVKGHLVKAPMFDGVPGFKKEENSLFEIPVRASAGSGAIFINMDAARMRESENDAAEQLDEDSVGKFLDLEKNKSRWLDGRTVECGFNWKHAADPTLFNIGIPDMPKSSLLRSFLSMKPSHTLALHIFPNSTIYKIADVNIWYSIVLLPVSPTKTHIRWDLYSKTDRPDPTVEKAIAFQIERMISSQAKAFETLPQIVTDENRESQSEILIHLKAHLKAEKALGKHISPPMSKAKISEKFIQSEILRKELDCLSNNTVKEGSKEQSILAW